MDMHSNEAVYASSDKSSQNDSTKMSIDNDIDTLLDGSVKNKTSVMSRSHGPDGLKGLFEPDGDLKLWLEHTRFFDIEYRNKVLDGLRKLKAIEEQRSEILLEIQNTAGAMVVPTLPLGRHNHNPSTASAFLPTSAMTPSDAPTTASTLHRNGYATKNEAKKTIPTTVDEDRGSRCTTMSSDDVGFVSDQVPRLLSKTNPKTETRYFLVKSFNTLNVDMSQRDGLWITKAKNGPAFIEAFNQSKSVILFFSINKSKAFQGYARMVTPPRADIAKAEWMGNIDWETSDPFRIEWLSTRRTEFWKFGNLRNSLNDDAPIFVGRDGQEYPEDCGRKVIEAMNRVVQKRTDSPSVTGTTTDDNRDRVRRSSRERSKKGDKANWRRLSPVPAEGTGIGTGSNVDEADSQDSMILIEY